MIIIRLPQSVQFFLGDLIGILWFDVFRIRRKVALENIKRCFPDWSDEHAVQVARRSLCNLGRSFIEFLRIPDVDPEKWRSHFQLHGVENYEKAFAKAKGVCILSAHIGNGDWGTLGLVLNNYHIYIISKEFKLKLLNDFWFATRRSLGTEFISDRGSSLTILKLLKKNKAIVFVLDQFLGPPIGIKTTFFGHETGTGMGLALLAERSNAPVVPVYTYRDERGGTHIVFEPEIPFVELANKEDTIKNMTQIYCNKIEEWVRAYPEQWLWVHRRWKKYKR